MILLPRCLRYYYILPFMLLDCITIVRSQLFLKVRIVATFMSKPLVLALMFLKVILILFKTLQSRQNPQTFSSVGSAKTTKGYWNAQNKQWPTMSSRHITVIHLYPLSCLVPASRYTFPVHKHPKKQQEKPIILVKKMRFLTFLSKNSLGK